MKRILVSVISCAFFIIVFDSVSLAQDDGNSSPCMMIAPVPLDRVKINDPFWSKRQDINRETSIPSQLGTLEKVGSIDNFRVAAGEKHGAHRGFFYADSDLYKWLEAASYSLGSHPDPALESEIDEIIRLISKAQLGDGYINTYYTIHFSERRWENIPIHHELYCAGHLIEAACAHYEATGKTTLLEVAVRLADNIAGEFGPGKNESVPGHEEIELALIRLYRITGDPAYLDTASFFIHERGRKNMFPSIILGALRDNSEKAKIVEKERERQGQTLESPYSLDSSLFSLPSNPDVLARIASNYITGRYFQAHAPVIEQNKGAGHAVRAMYLYSGMADLYAVTCEREMLEALERIWSNVADRKTYITGGVGSLAVIEGFGRDYELPNRSYTESCAAIGMAFWNWRMLGITGETKYADLFERALYNGILSGVSLDGKSYFYRNPLVSHGEYTRQEWYPTACCPPNLARFIASLGKYIYGISGKRVYVYQYIGSRAELDIQGRKVTLVQESSMPWEGRARFRIQTSSPVRFSLFLRAPSWCRKVVVKVNGEDAQLEFSSGTFREIDRVWSNGDSIDIYMRMEPEFVKADKKVRPNRGRAAIVRGPLVYCLEDKDNPGIDIHKTRIDSNKAMSGEYKAGLLGGVFIVRGSFAGDRHEFSAVPYYAWSNRGLSNMQVWNRVD